MGNQNPRHFQKVLNVTGEGVSKQGQNGAWPWYLQVLPRVQPGLPGPALEEVRSGISFWACALPRVRLLLQHSVFPQSQATVPPWAVSPKLGLYSCVA